MRLSGFTLPAAAAALMAGGALAPAFADSHMSQMRESEPQTLAVEGYDQDQRVVLYPDAMFEQARAIIDTVKSYYNADVVEESGQGAPQDVVDAIKAGQPLPEGAETRELPAELTEQLPGGVEWVAVGENLIALDDSGAVRAIYYEMLPLAS